MDRKQRLLYVLFSTLITALVLLAVVDITRFDHVIAYGIITLGVMFVAISTRWITPSRTLTLALALVVGIFASQIAPIPKGQLFMYDQHITVPFIEETLQNGRLPPAEEPHLRGAQKINNYPSMYAFGALILSITGLSSVELVNIFPLFILLSLPFVGYTFSSDVKVVGILLWLSPVLVQKTTVPQTFALPLLGVLLVSTLSLDEYRYRVLFILATIAVSVAHSYTPIVAIIAVTLYFGATVVQQRLNWIDVTGTSSEDVDFEVPASGTTIRPRTIALYLVVLSTVWVLSNNTEFLPVLGRLLTLDFQGVLDWFGIESTILGFFVDQSRALPPEVNYGIPRSPREWAGLFFRFVFPSFVLVLTGGIVLRTRSLVSEVVPPFSFFVAGISIFSFSFVVSAVGMNRNWLLLTLLSVPIVEFLVLTNRSNFRTTDVLLATFGLASGVVLVFSEISSGRFPDSFVLVLLCVIVVLVLERVFGLRSRGRLANFQVPTIRSDTVIVGVIVFLVLGHALVNVSPEVYSQQHREAAFNENPGLPHYHKPWDYSTAEFIMVYHAEDAGPAVGDVRVFVLEEFYRYELDHNVECYSTSCPHHYVVWYVVYDTIWQGVVTGPLYTSFPNGQHHLDTHRNKIYTTYHSSIYSNRSTP